MDNSMDNITMDDLTFINSIKFERPRISFNHPISEVIYEINRQQGCNNLRDRNPKKEPKDYRNDYIWNAIVYKELDILEELCKRDYNLNTLQHIYYKNIWRYNNTPIMYAIEKSGGQITNEIKMLMKYGANLKAKDNFGRGILYYAKKYPIILKYLIVDCGVVPTRKELKRRNIRVIYYNNLIIKLILCTQKMYKVPTEMYVHILGFL